MSQSKILKVQTVAAFALIQRIQELRNDLLGRLRIPAFDEYFLKVELVVSLLVSHVRQQLAEPAVVINDLFLIWHRASSLESHTGLRMPDHG